MRNLEPTSSFLDEHDSLIIAVRDLARTFDANAVAMNFVSGLLAARYSSWSTLTSFALSTSLPQHTFFEVPNFGRQCGMCGAYLKLDMYPEQEDAWQRIRTKGNDYIDDLRFTYYDLFHSSSEDPEPQNGLGPPDTDAQSFFNMLIGTLADLPKDATIKTADRALKTLLKAADKRNIFLGILGVCGVLATDDHPGLWPAFVWFKDRCYLDPGNYSYPVAWWKGRDGVSGAALEHFGLTRYLAADTISKLRY